MKYIYILILLVLASWQVQAQVLDVSPEQPERGEKVTITYHTAAAGAKIGQTAAEVNIVFTYSTFYELPWKMPMVKKGEDWVASFVLQRYATYATFYIQSGDIVEKPSEQKHFEIPVYKGGKRVESGLLHEAYSLTAQMPKSADIATLKIALLEKELQNYPNNYEAKIALLNTRINLSKNPTEKLKYRNEARKIIEAKFKAGPTTIGNVNLVTMGYLMIGEKSRLDSVRKVIRERYPNSDLGKDLRADLIAREKDPAQKIQKLEALLKTGDQSGGEGSTNIHSLLFDLYTSAGDSVKALTHATRLVTKNSPQTSQTLKDIAEKLTERKIAPEHAIQYARKSLDRVAQWPVGIIRYFPEFGHIPSYVADSVRAKAVAEAKSALLSLIALNKLYQGDSASSLKYTAEALNQSNGREGILNSAAVYEQTGQHQKAFDALWKLLLKNPTDTVVLKQAKTNFMKFNSSSAEFETKVSELEKLELAQLREKLKKQLMNKPGPELSGITDLEGKAVTPEMMKGKIVVLDFWATWCVPCMQEMPYFHKVYQQYKDNPDVIFMVVNSGANNTLADAKKWAGQNSQYTFPVYYNTDKNIGDKVGFTLIPTIVVLDQKGLMQFRTIGFEGEILQKKLAVEIELLLEGAKN
jgi:thiol-disulfide isomerase/thioredoxin